jgi:hypothetical protein
MQSDWSALTSDATATYNLGRANSFASKHSPHDRQQSQQQLRSKLRAIHHFKAYIQTSTRARNALAKLINGVAACGQQKRVSPFRSLHATQERVVRFPASC